ncbi:hypothetical protein Vadar_032902 [Vaccinium darrowii]|uniref:Uncharacterized protein n=1 Tax=Vaccinium darrowii TaxID=229202 RepID=A0ACB7YRT4_9ERIC|nr:hypothetical protein Vadar_032902 [Vaccinium darrowii]
MRRRMGDAGWNGPLGTDSSDVSYLLVTDSRYSKIADKKSRLAKLFLAQAIVQSITVLNFIPTPRELDRVAFSLTAIAFLSILMGELGRRHGRISLLMFYLCASSFTVLNSLGSAHRSNFLVEVIGDTSPWKVNSFRRLTFASILLGWLLQTLASLTALSLVANVILLP